jgi:hypothetical protein
MVIPRLNGIDEQSKKCPEGTYRIDQHEQVFRCDLQ